MTVLVGVRCSDGVVIGSDSIATSAMGNSPLVHLQSNDKIQILSGSVIVAATGAVGLSQRLSHHVEQAISGQVFKNLDRHGCTTNISTRFLNDCSKTMVQSNQQSGIGFGALMAAVIKGEPCLVEYDPVGFQPEVKEGNLFFVSMGSGQVLADPFLAFVSRVLWKRQLPTVKDATFGVHWVLDHTIKLAPGGVGGAIKIAILRKNASSWLAEEIQDLQQATQYISELEQHIGSFAQKAIDEAPASPVPEPPK